MPPMPPRWRRACCEEYRSKATAAKKMQLSKKCYINIHNLVFIVFELGRLPPLEEVFELCVEVHILDEVILCRALPKNRSNTSE